MNRRHVLVAVLFFTLSAVLVSETALAQAPVAIVKRSENKPLKSLKSAAEAALEVPARPEGFPFVIPNRIPKEDLRTQVSETDQPDQLTQQVEGSASTNLSANFDGTDNDANGRILGFRVAPPDTNGDVGDTYFVQMINLLTTVFDKFGGLKSGPFPSNAFWSGIGGLCEAFNQGDPIVLYDETKKRWLVSQFAFTDALTDFAQCVAISETNDPMGGYHRYEFDFNDIGFPDYPKHGITTESITMMANIFSQRGPFFRFDGTFIGVMDKAAMYAGNPASLVGFNLGSNEFGFVAGDLDDASGTAGFVPALFATAMSNSSQFDVWQIDIDWNNAGGASANQVAAVPITAYDPDLCGASREACIPQPGTNQMLEALSDRLMHRLQIRDFGSYRTMVASHTVDVGGGRAGIRWYELRESGGGWSLYQEGTYAPNDGLYRWMPSIAMNAAGDIGLGYLASDGLGTYMSTVVNGQTAANSGSGVLDGIETFCISGSGAQTGTARAGDYSATSVDPVSDTFWHTNEYGPWPGGDFVWATRVCEFAVSGGTEPDPDPPAAPSDLVATAASSSQIDLSWTNNATNADYIEVERSPDDVNYTVIASLGPSENSYSDTGLPASTIQYYRVQAFNTDGGSGYSNVASATTLDDGGGSDPDSVHVENIVTGTINEGRGFKRGFADVTIHDNLGQPVEGALVSGTFSGTFNESGSETTGSDGTVRILTSSTERGGVTVNFCVDAVSASLPYDSSDNSSASYDCSGSQPELSGTVSKGSVETPEGFELGQNFPNPFNPVTALNFTVPAATHVTLRVYNLLGEEIATLVDEYRDAGRHYVRFDASDQSTGVYIYTMRAGNFTASGRMTLLK